MAGPGNQHCANCIGTLSFPIYRPSACIYRRTVRAEGDAEHILKLKCTKLDFGWGSDQDPARGA